MSSYFFLTILIELNAKLSLNRDLIFESKQLNILTLLIHIVDYNLSRFMIRNDINLSVILFRYTRLNKILEYETTSCFQIDLKHVFIIERFVKTILFKHLIK